MANFAINFGIGLGLQFISALTTPPQRIGKLESRSLPDASYGSEIGKGYGLFPFRAVLTHLPEQLTEAKNARGKLGGKTIEYTYSATMQFVVADGQIASIPYLTVNGDVEVDLFSTKTETLAKSHKFLDKIVFRPGSEVQSPVSALEAIAPNGIAPPNRGIAHVTLPNWPLSEKLGNRPPLIQGLAATVGSEIPALLKEYLPRPLQWAGPVANNLYVDTRATFTAAQSTTVVLPLKIDYQFLLAGANPSVSVDGNLLTYLPGPQVWRSRFVDVLAMPAAEASEGAFVDVSINQNTVQYRINGALVDSFTVASGSRTITVTATDWTGTEASEQGSMAATQFQPSLIALADILDDICVSAGIDCDTTEITDSLIGVTLQGPQPADWISQLQSIYGFLVVDRGGIIHFLDGDRPPSVERVASLEDFGLADGDLYQVEQAYPSELPYQCEVLYFDLADKQEKSAYFRLDSHDESDRPLNSTVLQVATNSVMTARQAQGVAEMTLIRAWNERETITMTGTFEHADLEPGDVLVLPIFGQQVRLLITETNLGADYTVEFKCLRYSRAAWRAKQTPTVTTAVTEQSAEVYPRLFASDSLPKLKGADPANPVYFAAGHQIPAYRQASVLASADAGNSYAQAVLQRGAAAIGVSGKLAVAGVSVVVRCSDILSTVTADTFANNSTINRLAIGNEIIRFRDALLLGSHRGFYYYRLTFLQRGQLGTTATAHPLHRAIALCSDLIPVDREDLGNAGATIRLNLLTDGADSPIPECDLVL